MVVVRALVAAAMTALLTALAAAPAGAGGGGGGGPCRGFGEGAELRMLDNCFEGTGHAVEAGTTVTVVNAGALPHTFTAVDGSFDSGVLLPGETWEVAITEPGQIPVYCTLHATADGFGMAGLLAVTGPATTLPAAEGEAGEAGVDWSALWVLGVLIVAAAGVLHARRSVGRSTEPRDADTGLDREA